jgi:hypothetical protein
MTTITLSKEDWVILRLLKLFANDPHIAGKLEYIRSVNFLIKKHGSKTVSASIDQLHAERST